MARYRTAIDVDYVVREYVSGKSSNQLALVLGVSRRTIGKRLVDKGVRLRSQSEAEVNKWSTMDRLKRLKQIQAAHDAVRGTSRSHEELCSRATAKQQNLSVQRSPLEDRLLAMLANRGVSCRRQTAIGPYNCDLSFGRVAVEVWGGKWHFTGRHFERFPKRTRYILDRGWDLLVLVVIANRFPLVPAVADYVAAYLKRMRRNPPKVRQYRVVWGAGEFTAGGSAKDDEITIVPPFTCRRNPRTGQYETVPR